MFSSVVTSTDGSGAAAKVGLAGDDENGFAGALPAAFEAKGFEKGFTGAVVDGPPLTPNSDAPIWGCGFSSCSTLGFSGLA